ncbi:hypothetical protein [Oceanobacillus kapialis]|uniref:DNA-directed RNA polymerase subunit beta n=1 Tax=Oceanobacillus kapialis TaxID=481353 RepID=A0ABW5Q3A2_9BACI
MKLSPQLFKRVLVLLSIAAVIGLILFSIEQIFGVNAGLDFFLGLFDGRYD